MSLVGSLHVGIAKVCVFFYEDDEDGEDDKNDEDEYQVIKVI